MSMTKSLDSDNSSFNDFSELTDLNSHALDADELKEVLAAELSADTVQRYLQQISSKPLFTPEEELKVATRAKAGDFSARQAMIEHNLRLVVSIAKTYMHRGLPLPD